MASSRAIPAAILGSAAMLSVAVYLGLRDRPAAEQQPVADVAHPVPTAAAPTPRAPFEHRERRLPDELLAGGAEVHEDTAPEAAGRAEAPRSVAATTPPTTTVAVLASAQAEARRSEIRSACWDNLPSGESDPSSVPLVVTLSFDPEGNVLASGTKESRDARRDGVASCVGRKLHDMRIDPPGTHVSVEIPIEVP